MSEDGLADNESEAHRMALDEGLRELGYRNGDTPHHAARLKDPEDTGLRRIIGRIADAMALLALSWVFLTFLYGFAAREFAIPPFAVAVLLYVIDYRVLATREPAVSNRLGQLLADLTGGGNA